MKRKAPLAVLGVLAFVAAGIPSAHSGGRVLTVMDVVAIKVVNDPGLDTTTRVEPDGTINFPYVGRIKAAGLTQDDLAQVIERRLVELGVIAGPELQAKLGFLRKLRGPSVLRDGAYIGLQERFD